MALFVHSKLRGNQPACAHACMYVYTSCMCLCVQVCIQVYTQAQAQVHTQAHNIQVNVTLPFMTASFLPLLNALVCTWASSTNDGPFWPVFWVFDFAQAPSRSLDRGLPVGP
jgi:hypothetical protein